MEMYNSNLGNVEEAKRKFMEYEENKLKDIAQAPKQQQTENKRTAFKFEKREFKGTQETDMITTQEFGKVLANEFVKVFSDFAGCIIVPGPKGEPNLIMYFKDGPVKQGMIKGIKLFSNNTPSTDEGISKSAADLIAATSRMKTKRLYDLTREAKEALSEYMQTERNGAINWNQKISEQSASGYAGGPILVQVEGFNLINIIKGLYGSKYKVKVGEKTLTKYYEFGIQLLAPVKNPYQNIQIINGRPCNNTPTNFVMTITRLDSSKVNEKAMLFGQPTALGTIPMCVPDNM